MVKTKAILIYQDDYIRLRELRENEIIETLKKTSFADIIKKIIKNQN